ncbi:MAG: SHOCT domain-containing protein [Acidimicrobiia bacterium]|nr:SHOCT domain-containing protein [Acidimicrobiia bacterium]
MGRRRGGVVRGVARTAAVAGTASAVSGRVHHRQNEKWAAENQEAYAQQQQAAYDQGVADAAPPPPPPPAADDADDNIAQLERLAKLKEQGILTDDEFAAEKAKILAG